MNVLIVQTAFLGDIVLSTPVIAAVKEKHPEARIYFLTTVLGKELLKNDPRINAVLVFDKRNNDRGIPGLVNAAKRLKQHKFSFVYSLHKSWRTALLLRLAAIPNRIGFSSSRLSFLYTQEKNRNQRGFFHDVQRNLFLLDVSQETPADRYPLALYPPKHISSKLSNEYGEQIALPETYLLVAPGSAWRTKRWSSDRFKELVQLLSVQHTVVLVGSKEEQALCASIGRDSSALNLAGMLSLNDLLLVIKNASGVVCNDSVVLHIASAFKRPVVALFCATSPTFGFGPWETVSEVLQSEVLACKPCKSHGSHLCPTGTERCRTDVRAEQVHNALRRLKCLDR